MYRNPQLGGVEALGEGGELLVGRIVVLVKDVKLVLQRTLSVGNDLQLGLAYRKILLSELHRDVGRDVAHPPQAIGGLRRR